MRTSILRASLFVIVSFSIFTVFSTQLFYKNAIGILESWSQSSKMTVYLKIESTEEDKNAVSDFLKTIPEISMINWVDRKQASQSFQATLKEFSSGLITDNELLDLIPESFEIDLAPHLSSEQRESTFLNIQEKLKVFNFIDEVSYSAVWLKKFQSVKKVLNSVGIFVLTLILITFAYLVSLMSQVLVESSKAEIEVYSLIGATRWSIYIHFLKFLFRFLFVSIALAYGGAYALFLALKEYLKHSSFSYLVTSHLSFLPLKDSILLVAMILIVILSSTYMTIRASVNRLTQLSYE